MLYLTGYKIERKDGGGDWYEVARVAANSTTWDDPILPVDPLTMWRIVGLGLGERESVTPAEVSFDATVEYGEIVPVIALEDTYFNEAHISIATPSGMTEAGRNSILKTGIIAEARLLGFGDYTERYRAELDGIATAHQVPLLASKYGKGVNDMLVSAYFVLPGGLVGMSPQVSVSTEYVSGEDLGEGSPSATTFLRGDQTWAELPTPTDAVLSVAGKTGAVTLVKGDVGLGNVDNTADAAKNVATAAALTTSRNIDGQPFNGTGNITVIAPGTHAATSKATPVDTDELPLVDSAASNVLKRLTWANLKTTAKTYFDTLYQSLDSDLTALAALAATAGILARTGAGAFAVRTIIGTANKVSVTNGDGASGNPTLTLPSTVVITTSLGVGVTPDPSMAFEVSGSSRVTAAGGNAPMYMIGGSGCVEMWPGAIGSGVGKAFGAAVPGSASGNDFIFSIYKAGAGGWNGYLRIQENGNVVIGNLAALATTTTDGFLYVPTCAGTPTGVPTAFTGKVPMVVDTSGSKLWFYIGGVWKSVALT
jgi:hypothetical protein